jgi:hypothetical protein
VELGKFLIAVISTHRNFQIKMKIRGWRCSTFTQLAELTSYLNFECNFNEKGLCKARQGEGWGIRKKADMCCCRACRFNVGYLYEMTASKLMIEEYARLFNEKTGFWRAKTGCILPRKMRSGTCVTYNCDFNIRRPDSHVILIEYLRGKPKGAMIVDGKKTFESRIVPAFKRWLKMPPTYKLKGKEKF